MATALLNRGLQSVKGLLLIDKKIGHKREPVAN